MGVYVGIDGGGSKTEAAALDTRSGRAIRRQGPASNPVTVGWNQAVVTVQRLVQECLLGLEGAESDLVGLSACMAGIDHPSQGERMAQQLSGIFPKAKVEVVNDAFAALTGGTEGQPGLVLNVGTGSVAAGETGTKRQARSGGYGHFLGDEGSGYDIGRQGLMAAIQGFEGRGQETTLWQQTARVFAVHHPLDLIPKIYDAPHPVGKIAGFAPYVLSLATGDEVADGIARQATAAHVALIHSVFQQLEVAGGLPVVLTGGLLLHEELLRNRLRKALSGVDLRPLTVAPAQGALLRALREASTAYGGQEFTGLEEVLVLWRRGVAVLSSLE